MTKNFEREKKKKNKNSLASSNNTDVVRPKSITVVLPISTKDFAAKLKLKVSDVVKSFFLEGAKVSINSFIDDEVLLQVVAHNFDVEVVVDHSIEHQIAVTKKSVEEEINEVDEALLSKKNPVIAFMGHVDHGKTSLIDYIRKSSIVKSEEGAITQNIGAFLYKEKGVEMTILDTPGHCAFSNMRLRGASVTDIVILVIAGDEGIKDQTVEAINQAKNMKCSILVAINKSDKNGFDPENVYRQLAENDLLPEAWGGGIVTVNCSAITGEGIDNLLHMIMLQSELLELKVNEKGRGRGIVMDAYNKTGLGNSAMVIMQNGILNLGDFVVVGNTWGKIKSIVDDRGKLISKAEASQPVIISSFCKMPTVGDNFVVVSNEKEAKKIVSIKNVNENVEQSEKINHSANIFEPMMDKKKVVNIIMKTNSQGSLGAVCDELNKIKSGKITLNVVSCDVGNINESDVDLASTFDSAIFGFNVDIDKKAELLIKQLNINVHLHSLIYDIIDNVKSVLNQNLDQIIVEEKQGLAEIIATFKGSKMSTICGCKVVSGKINKNHFVRLIKNDKEIWNGKVHSIKREKNTVSEVSNGMECGIILDNNNEVEIGDKIESYEKKYISQEL